MTLHVYATSLGRDPAALRPGEDLVLHAPPHHGAAIPQGCLVDDHLDATAREHVDGCAAEALARWRTHIAPELVDHGVSLVDIWESELYCEVFLEVERAVTGVRAAAQALGAARVTTDELERSMTDALAEVLAPAGVEVIPAAGDPAAPSYPLREGAPPHQLAARPLSRRLARGTLDLVGLPSVPRGDVVVVPYAGTVPVLERLAEHGLGPVLVAAFPPSPRLALGAVRRGGWLGLPGAWSRGRARRRTLQRLATLRERPVGTAVEVLRHRRALRCLEQRAAETPASVAAVTRALRRARRIRVVLVPFDAEPVARTLVVCAQRAGVPVLALQHGYEPFAVVGRVGAASDAVGSWDEASRLSFPEERRATVRVVGNPAAMPIRASRPRPPSGRRTALVLVEGAARASARVDRRAAARHLGAALDGLRAARHDWEPVVRPHPADDPLTIEQLARDVGHAGVAVDGSTPIQALMDRSDLCIGAMSTVSLQTAAAGLPLVMLDVTGVALRPPLDGSGGVLRVTDASGVAAAADRLASGDELPGRDALLEALGAGRDATGAVLDWLRELAYGTSNRRAVYPEYAGPTSGNAASVISDDRTSVQPSRSNTRR